ncbi:olfactory receptor 6F1-like [Alligator mississippiensis]|uniref:olfactory receptor 6F1-like n=1 Tax=Alligator mississippiensis TaxID=8496 RepID=UPI00287792C7|nr:olfactory receptor 6F1-like [Alligator mississippiensis]XP_059570260.1 olfactory receptor 6F1-like [Alligator mississippiensis]
MAGLEQGNQTLITEFVFRGFGDVYDLQSLLFLLFLMIYILTLVGNAVILALVVTDHCLRTPMYFFLGNLSFLEICYTSTILPRMLASLLNKENGISLSGCFFQFYAFGSFACSECYLLSAMSYDRFLAICKPLHYGGLMNTKVCIQLAAWPWVIGFVANGFTSFLASQLTFCGSNKIDHFFCDYTPLLVLSCSETHTTETAMSIVATVCTVPPFLLTVTSYICIIATILKIPSTTGRKKAFSTCSSHLIVVIMFYGALMTVYLLPKNDVLKDLNKLFSLFYTVLTPLLNPLIYSLRNKDFRVALSKSVNKHMPLLRVQIIRTLF